ncbi:hypothetical protein H0H92_015551 [Tricholoma furcatifolium]|nr:hypothetical protein H0H92_015551 [Tricholoma furcatifolium]
MSHPRRCLVLIDLQNEFIGAGGHFPIHNDSRRFLQGLPSLATAFHVSGYPIFWIRSEYAKPKKDAKLVKREHLDSTAYLAGTHTGQIACCVKGTLGADFPPDVQLLIDKSDPENIILTKTWYSAFKESSFFDELKRRDITELFVGGLLTNVCVNATVNDALSLGFRVTLLEDCLGWRKRASHDRALRAMANLGANISANGPQNPVFDCILRNKLPELFYVNGSIPSWRVMMALHEKRIKFRRTRLLVMSNPKETRLPDFLQLNHRGKTPVFVDISPIVPNNTSADPANNIDTTSHPSSDDVQVIINESLAILHYIEAHHDPTRPLLPPLSNRAAHACALARIQETENLRLIYDALEDAHFDAEHAGGKLEAAERERLIASIEHELDYWETYAAKTTFIAGDEFGLADCAFFPIVAYIVHRGFDWRRRVDSGFEDAWPNLKAYYHRVWDRGERDGCAQKSHPDGWERKGKANIWRGTKGSAKGLYKRTEDKNGSNAEV